jgi:hypothetical protein
MNFRAVRMYESWLHRREPQAHALSGSPPRGRHAFMERSSIHGVGQGELTVHAAQAIGNVAPAS